LGFRNICQLHTERKSYKSCWVSVPWSRTQNWAQPLSLQEVFRIITKELNILKRQSWCEHYHKPWNTKETWCSRNG
jgi:hypothetical protein